MTTMIMVLDMVATKRLLVPMSELCKRLQELHSVGYLDVSVHFPGCRHTERQGVDSSYAVLIAWGKKT